MRHNNISFAYSKNALAFSVIMEARLVAVAKILGDLGLRLIGHTITSGRHRPWCNKACGFALPDAEGATKMIPNMTSNEAYTHVKTSGSKV